MKQYVFNPLTCIVGIFIVCSFVGCGKPPSLKPKPIEVKVISRDRCDLIVETPDKQRCYIYNGYWRGKTDDVFVVDSSLLNGYQYFKKLPKNATKLVEVRTVERCRGTDGQTWYLMETFDKQRFYLDYYRGTPESGWFKMPLSELPEEIQARLEHEEIVTIPASSFPFADEPTKEEQIEEKFQNLKKEYKITKK